VGRHLVSTDLQVEEVIYVSENLSHFNSQNAIDDVELLFIIFEFPWLPLQRRINVAVFALLFKP
jgi:hypothetical protein